MMIMPISILIQLVNINTIGGYVKKIPKVNHWFLEPVVLLGEGEYNMDNLKEITVTDSYLTLDQES